jgi:transcriptional regulator with XRE-family HTH domain
VCIITRVQSELPPAPDDNDPELMAGQEIQRLRRARGWSQDEVARKMKPYGYDFNQALISRIELGQRPLRVRELVDFAALFGLQPAALLKPWPQMSLESVEAAIAELEPALEQAEALAGKAESARREALTIEARLNLLRQRQNALKGGKGGGT